MFSRVGHAENFIQHVDIDLDVKSESTVLFLGFQP